MQQQRDVIRKRIRQKRKSLTIEEQKQAAQAICQLMQQHPLVQKAQKIAITLAYDGEIGTHPFIDWCWHQGKQVYLPIVHPSKQGQLLFLEYSKQTEMLSNRYGILEPKLEGEQTCPVTGLDIIFTPLVAFDYKGNRIGMGGGYYDRTLAPWFSNKIGPYPIGLAHDCQLVKELPTEFWDVPLPEIITPSKRHSFITKN